MLPGKLEDSASLTRLETEFGPRGKKLCVGLVDDPAAMLLDWLLDWLVILALCIAIAANVSSKPAPLPTPLPQQSSEPNSE